MERTVGPDQVAGAGTIDCVGKAGLRRLTYPYIKQHEMGCFLSPVVGIVHTVWPKIPRIKLMFFSGIFLFTDQTRLQDTQLIMHVFRSFPPTFFPQT